MMVSFWPSMLTSWFIPLRFEILWRCRLRSPPTTMTVRSLSRFEGLECHKNTQKKRGGWRIQKLHSNYLQLFWFTLYSHNMILATSPYQAKWFKINGANYAPLYNNNPPSSNYTTCTAMFAMPKKLRSPAMRLASSAIFCLSWSVFLVSFTWT